MSKPAPPSRNKPAVLAIRLILLVLLGTGAAYLVMQRRSPMSVSEDEVRGMISGHELNGLTLAEAARRLQHRATDVNDGLVVIDFHNVKGWKSESVILDVKAGKVAGAWFGKLDDSE